MQAMIDEANNEAWEDYEEIMQGMEMYEEEKEGNELGPQHP